MRRSPVRRAVWLLPLTTTLALVCALAAFGATTRSSAAPTLVVDNSFTIKTSDPQRAFDPTASIIDRAIYDTLFTYNKGDLTTPIPLLVQSWKASNGAKTFTFQLKKNVHFAERDAAHVGGRRLLAQPARSTSRGTRPSCSPASPSRRKGSTRS